MDGSYGTRKASLGRTWEPLTDEHERQLDRAERTLSDFERGDPVDPLAVVGAYRSGKTQLLYHLFDTAWERGIPAFYIGDPGELIHEFRDADEIDINTWIQSRIDDQLLEYSDGNTSEVRWFPNVDTETKREFVSQHGDDIEVEETVRTVLIFDEVEQSYRDFIHVLDKDDLNPLRKINDGLQDSVKIWSFGMISAYEFIGEADWGRMTEIRIPPLAVEDVRNQLKTKQPEATKFANIIWWLARGRTGLTIKLIDELPNTLESGATKWIRDLAEVSFRETRLINNRWTELPRTDWEQAVRALLFLEDGLGTWQIEDETALTRSECQQFAIEILKEEFPFEQNEVHRNALEILDRNVGRIFDGFVVPENGVFPSHGLADQEEAAAFLSLVEDTILSFEPTGSARSVAIEALEAAEGSFHTDWNDRASDSGVLDFRVATVAPTVLKSVFPPIAVNPERVSIRTTEQLEETINRGLTLDTNDSKTEFVNVVFCPTRQSFDRELSDVTDGLDITAPTVLVVPEDRDFDTDDTVAEVYSRHHLLRIESHQSTRFWTFVLHLLGRLKDEDFSEPTKIGTARKDEILNRCEDREVRNTIETLYDQLYQVSVEYSEAHSQRYFEAYSLVSSENLLWEEDRLSGVKPFWSSGEFVESTVALSYLLVLSPEYGSDISYSHLPECLITGIKEELVAADNDGFQFKSYLQSLFTQTGYSEALVTEREHYRENGELAPAVKQTRDALTDLALLSDDPTIIQKLDDPDFDLQTGEVTVMNIDGLSHLGYGLMRALLVAGLTTKPDEGIDIINRLLKIGERSTVELENVRECKDEVEEFADRFKPPTTIDIGSWISIETGQLDRYEKNLEGIVEGVEDLITVINGNLSAGPIAYHYWALLDQYLDDISRKVDSLQLQIPPSGVKEIFETVELFEDTYRTISRKEYIADTFDDRDQLLKHLEAYGDEIFNLRLYLEHRGAMLSFSDEDLILAQVDTVDEEVFATSKTEETTDISIPEHNDVLQELDRNFRQHKSNLQTMRSDLDRIETVAETLDSKLIESREKLQAFLEPPESFGGTND